MSNPTVLRKFVVRDRACGECHVEASQAEVQDSAALVFRGPLDVDTLFEETIAAFAPGEWREFHEVDEFPAELDDDDEDAGR